MFRIVPFIGEEPVQSILAMRLANRRHLGPTWSVEHVGGVEIDAAETVGEESRGRFHDPLGAASGRGGEPPLPAPRDGDDGAADLARRRGDPLGEGAALRRRAGRRDALPTRRLDRGERAHRGPGSRAPSGRPEPEPHATGDDGPDGAAFARRLAPAALRVAPREDDPAPLRSRGRGRSLGEGREGGTGHAGSSTGRRPRSGPPHAGACRSARLGTACRDPGRCLLRTGPGSVTPVGEPAASRRRKVAGDAAPDRRGA